MRSLLSTREGFEAFYGRHYHKLVAFFVRRVFDSSLALDLTAETFAQALLSVKRLRASNEDEALAWLFGIARNQLKGFYRHGVAEKRALERLGLEPPELTQDAHRQIEELADLDELRRLVTEALSALSEAERRAVELRVIHELTYPEVASRLAISEDAARARVSRGLRSLAQALDGNPALKELT